MNNVAILPELILKIMQKQNIKHKINNRYLTSQINDENMSFVYSFARLIRIKEKNFINAIKNHINSIAKKDYSSLLNINSPDYVFIFMPHELALISAQKKQQYRKLIN